MSDLCIGGVNYSNVTFYFIDLHLTQPLLPVRLYPGFIIYFLLYLLVIA